MIPEGPRAAALTSSLCSSNLARGDSESHGSRSRKRRSGSESGPQGCTGTGQGQPRFWSSWQERVEQRGREEGDESGQPPVPRMTPLQGFQASLASLGIPSSGVPLPVGAALGSGSQ